MQSGDLRLAAPVLVSFAGDGGGDRTMKYVPIVATLLVGSVPLIVASEAEAVVCARGFYRAGCIGPRGGVVVRRGLYPRRAV